MEEEFPCKGCLVISVCIDLCDRVLKNFRIKNVDTFIHQNPNTCVFCGGKLNTLTTKCSNYKEKYLECTMCRYRRYITRRRLGKSNRRY